MAQDMWPSAKLRLSIRFDEFGQVTRLKTKADAQNAQRTTKNLNGVADNRGDLNLVEDSTAPPGVSRFLLLSTASANALGAQKATPSSTFFRIGRQLPQKSADGLTFDLVCVPVEFTWKQNGFKQADTLGAKVRYVDLPFDPRLVRSYGVELVFGTLSADDYAAGTRGERRTLPDGSTELKSLVPDTYTDAKGRTRTNIRFQGFGHELSAEWPDDDEAIVTIEAQDNTLLIIDQEASPKLVLDMKKPIHEAVAQLLSHYPQMEGLSVEYLPAGEEPPVLEKVLANTAFRPNLGPQPGKGSKLSVWDYVIDVCGSVGHMCRLDGTRIIIQRVRSLMTSQATPRPDDPFQGRQLATNEQLQWRRMVLGQNLYAMKVSRRYQRHVPVNVEVRNYDCATKSVLVARFPEDNDRNAWAIPGDTTDQKWSVFRTGFAGIKDKVTLKRAAQEIYESLGRNEIQIECQSSDLWSIGGSNEDPDLLDLASGDTVEILVARSSDEVSTISKLEEQLTTPELARAYAKSLGYSEELAAAFATAYTSAGFITQFKLKTTELTWSQDEGVDMKLGLINYLQIRADKLGLEEPDNTPRPPPKPPLAGPPPAQKPPGFI